MPGPPAGSKGVARLEIVARASDNGAFAIKDIRMQTTERLRDGKDGTRRRRYNKRSAIVREARR